VKVNESLFLMQQHERVASRRHRPRALSDPSGRHPQAGRVKRRINGQSAHGDGESIGPSTVDLEIGIIQSCVRSCQTSRGLRCVPRQWQYREIHGPRVHRTPLGAGWDWPGSLPVAACWNILG